MVNIFNTNYVIFKYPVSSSNSLNAAALSISFELRRPLGNPHSGVCHFVTLSLQVF